MPVKLDPSRPIYCAECMPLVREEQKGKKPVDKPKTEEPPQPNRPRIVGEVKNLPVKPPVERHEVVRREPAPSLVAELTQQKGGALETDKQKLGSGEITPPHKKKKKKKNRSSVVVPTPSPAKPAAKAAPEADLETADMLDEPAEDSSNHERPDSVENVENLDARSATVFKPAVSSVRPTGSAPPSAPKLPAGSGPKKVSPGEKIKFYV
jgi:hypothetical protein